jgi:hypothetical protein
MRQQAKWVVYGLMVALSGFILVRTFFSLINPLVLKQVMLVIVDTVVECLLWLIIPLSFAIAILRYKLWEIDILINRTLVYIPLTAILTGLYSASITLFQKIFIATTGEKSDAALVMTTFVLVSTFTPIKSGLQTVVDKRFKECNDPLKEINALDEQVRTVVEVLDARLISRRLLQTSIRAFHASGGAVYLQQDRHMRLAHATQGWKDEDQRVSILMEWNGRQLGQLILGGREDGHEYSDQEREVLQQAANRVARAIAGFKAEE